MATSLNVVRVQILFLLSVTYGRLVDYFYPHNTDFSTLAAGAIHSQCVIHTLHWNNGQSAPGGGKKQQVISVELDFWGRMASIANEKDLVGSFPTGTANSDWNTFGDPSFWDGWGPSVASSVQCMDPDTPPTFFIESTGMIVHWKITVALVAIL